MLVQKSLLLVLVTAASVSIAANAHASQSAEAEPPSFYLAALPSFTAVQVLLFPESDRILDRSQLDFSSKGMKITRGESRHRQIFMQDFVSNQAWLIAPGRSIQHEVLYETDSLETLTSNDAEASSVSSDSSVAPQDPPRSGLLSPAPCMSYPRLKRLKIDRWRGQSVSAWECLDASGTHVVSDYFSEDWKLVIRSELVGFQTEELRGITALSFSSTHFQVDDEYAPVSLDELMNGTNVRSRKYE